MKKNSDANEFLRPRFGKIGTILLIWPAYFVSGKMGLFFAIVHSSITALWPPSGIALASFFLFGRWVWPGIFLGAFTANFSRDTPFWPSAGIAFGNTLAGFIGAEALHRMKTFHPDFSRIRDVWLFGLVAGAIDPICSASIGVFTLWQFNLIASVKMIDAWQAWWSGDAIGILIITPIFFLISSTEWHMPTRKRVLEALFMVATFFGAAALVFSPKWDLLFLVYPLSVWAAIRFRHVGVVTLALILAFVGTPLLILEVAPTAQLDQSSLLILVYRLQLFLGTAGLTGMLLAADIKSRTRAESSLAEKDEQLQMILSNTPDHLFIQDQDLRYTFVVNPQLGLTLQDMLNKTDYDITSPEDAERLTRIKRWAMTSGVPTHLEIPIVSKAGETEFFDGSYVPKRNPQGKVTGIIGYFRNVTERKNAEKTRIAWEESESANRAKDQFIATLSHELRTPLTAILSWAQLIKAEKLDEEKMKMGLQAIEDCALMQNQLINDLLDVSRIVTGKLILKPKRVNVHAVLLSAIDAIRPAAEKKSIEILEIHEATNLEAMADPTRLKQIFWNLLSNSVKFTPNKGKIEVTLDWYKGPQGPSIRVRVTDTGEGLAPEILPTLFRRFSQADASSTRAHGGMGLGLSLTRSLLEMQKGSVEATSAGVNKGSTFTVFLPLLEGKQATTDSSIPSAAELARLSIKQNRSPLSEIKVLLVDDEPNTREAIQVALSFSGAEVKAASSAKEALALLKDFAADVILSDVAMPQEDGLAFMRKVRASNDQRIRKIPAIAFSAFAGPEVANATHDAGFQTYLAKPVDAL
ncbi:MAG: hybrid sensor histidine kinase/response regulator, partial [Bdellovibrionota bacterium]